MALALGAVLFLHLSVVWSQDPVKDNPPSEEKKLDPPAEAKPDPTGAKTGTRAVLGDDPKLEPLELDPKSPSKKDEAFNKLVAETKFLGDAVGQNKVASNMMWTLITGFLVMFMQAGFALVETGLTRGKNVAHTMAMNVFIYATGMMGFWLCGFAFMYGGNGAFTTMGDTSTDGLLNKEFMLTIGDHKWGVLGYDGFFLLGKAFDSGVMTLFLFQMVFMDTAATIPTGALAERWKFLSFTIYGFFMSMVIYPVYGNWVWGGGWLAKLGANYGLGHGHVDFAGSSVVHMVGGVASLAGILVLGPRIGKYNKDGTVNALPAHNVPMYMLGTLILAFGWFGFNPGSTLAGTDLNIGRIAANTMLASAAGAFMSTMVMWLVFKKPDPSFMCNGMLAGLVAITGPCAYVAPWAAVLIGLAAGALVVGSALLLDRVLKVDDPVGAVSVHGTCGAWGVLALGLFADGTYNAGWNNSYWYKLPNGALEWHADKLKELPEGWTEQGVTGLFYGNPSQLLAQVIGTGANIAWVFLITYAFFWVLDKIVGNRVTLHVEQEGLDIHEMGVAGYISEDPTVPEGHVSHATAEPRPATAPANGLKHYTVAISGIDAGTLKQIWSDLCQPTSNPPDPDFLKVYPHMTTVQGTRFRFRGGDPTVVSACLNRLFTGRSKSVHGLKVTVEGL
jgi:Amt family ammonium transporter